MLRSEGCFGGWLLVVWGGGSLFRCRDGKEEWEIREGRVANLVIY
jgi:hypothetical protein